MPIALLALTAALLQTTAPAWPSARSAHAMVYHDRMNAVLLYGGVTAAENDGLWSWNGREWRLQRGGPFDRGHFGFAYDTERNRVVLHGGLSFVRDREPDHFSDLWEWDGKSWKQVATTGGPGRRDHHAMVYDPITREVLLFGGQDSTNTVVNDTWGWNGRRWRKLADDGPPARSTHRMVWDPNRRVILLFGGFGAVGVLNDTWEWDGARWSEKGAGQSDGPSARFAARLAYDPVQQRVLLFGGRGNSGDLGDSWGWNGTRWTRLEVPGPPLRNVHELVTHPVRREVILFGGFNAPRTFNDVWTFDGSRWSPVSRYTATAPSGEPMRPGSHSVGYRVVRHWDRQRALKPKLDYEGRSNPGETATPALVSVWYPAGARGSALRIGDYRALELTSATLREIGPEDWASARAGLQGTARFGLGTELTSAQADEILGRAVQATRDAAPATGRFPLVVVGMEGGAGNSYGLAEYLASHGFVVIGAGNAPGVGALQVTNPAAALEAQTHRIELLYELSSSLEFVDRTRFAVVGKNFDGLAALNFQFRNMSADAVVTIDGWEAKPSVDMLRASPWFDPLKLRVPYLTFQQDHAPPGLTPGRDLFDQLKYAERQQYVVRDLDHVMLLNHGVDFPHTTAQRRLAYDFMYGTIVRFLEAYLKGDPAAQSRVRNATAGYPEWLILQRLQAPALAPVPTTAELETLVMSGDLERVSALYRQARANNPAVQLFSRETMALYAFRFWQQNQRDKSITLRQLNVEAYPNSANTHNELGNAYRDSGQPVPALESFRRALALVDSDAEIGASEKQQSREIIQRKVDALAAAAPATAVPAAIQEATRVFVLDGFEIPESVQYDADVDLYFVSNITEHGSRKDNTGYISRVRPDGTLESKKFIEGGRNGATLHAPKGMTFRGDTLWIADVDSVRAFDKRTGAVLGAIDLTRFGAILPNDVSFAPDGTLYISDTGLRFPEGAAPVHTGPNRIFRRAPNGTVDLAVEGAALEGPNGVLWDAAHQRLISVALRGRTIVEWKPGSAPRVIASGAGGYDGIIRTNDGRIMVSSLSVNAVQVLRGETLVDVITGVEQPADIGYDSRRNRVLIPLLSTNKIEVWQLR